MFSGNKLFLLQNSLDCSEIGVFATAVTQTGRQSPLEKTFQTRQPKSRNYFFRWVGTHRLELLRQSV